MNKKEVITKDDIEKYYNSTRKIKFKNDFKPKNITDIFTEINDSNSSLTTYFMNGSIHCDQYRARSLDDYIKLCKFYFPETTISEIVKIVYKKLGLRTNDTKSTLLSLLFCPTIKKDNFRHVYYHNPEYIKEQFNKKCFKGQGFPNCNVKYNEFLNNN